MSAQPQNVLSIYRHLLREASYLPPVCRAQIEPRIRHRFRKHRGDPHPDMRLRQAQHEYRNLRAANLGSMGRMYRVMLLAFGRIGWRRRALFTDLRQREQPGSSEELEDSMRKIQCSNDWLYRWDTDKIITFLKSQANQNPRNSPRPKVSLRKLDPKTATPTTNIWGKPFNEKTARSKDMKWWKQCAYRTLPPLPRSEWELLKQLALGQAGVEWDAPVRRIAATSAKPDTEYASSTWDWEKYAISPIRTVERPNSRRLRIFSGAGPVQPDSPYDGPAIGIHNYTPRFWRRLYTAVWQMTAVMEKKRGGSGAGWDITWGGVPLQLSSASTMSSEFFEGVDSNTGALLSRPGKKQPNKCLGKTTEYGESGEEAPGGWL